MSLYPFMTLMQNSLSYSLARFLAIDLLKAQLVKLDYIDGNPLLPKLSVDPTFLEQLSDPWRKAIVIKLLGRSVGFKALKLCIEKLWKPRGEMSVLDLGNDYFLVKFDLKKYLNMVISGRPWLVQGHYLTMRISTPDFNPNISSIELTLAWVRFPNLLVIYYDNDFIRALAMAIGTPVQIDENTSLDLKG